MYTLTYPIRILQVFSRMDRGGSETAIMNFYRNIDRAKVQFDFMVHTKDRCAYDDEIEALGGIIYRMDRYDMLNHFNYLKKWRQFFLSHPQYILIHGHYFTIASMYFRVAKEFDLVCIAHTHSELRGAIVKRIQMRVMTLPLRFISDYFFACSESAGLWLFGKKVIQDNRFSVLNNPVDSIRFVYNPVVRAIKRRELNLVNAFVVGHIGRFSKAKNHEFLVEVFAKVREVRPESVLLLVGDGELREAVERKIRECNLEGQVILAGIREDIPELLQAMDVFVFPSLYEGLGIAAVEAQAAGLPTVIANTLPCEAQVTRLVRVESLGSSAHEWARAILQHHSECTRENTYEEIVAAGFDAVKASKWLENFYLRQAKSKAEAVLE